MTDLQIVTGPNPEPLTAFAAAELARYARDLFGVAAAVNARPAEATASVWLDADGSGLAVPDDPQTYTLRRFTRPGPAAITCWPPAAARPPPCGRCTSWCAAGACSSC